MNLQGLETWLDKRNYRRGTVKLTLRQAKQAFVGFKANPREPAHPSTITSLKRTLAYCEDAGDSPKFSAWMRQQGIEKPTGTPVAKPKGRKLEAHSFSERDYRAVCDECMHPERARDPEAQVLYAIARTGLRVGDVLRIPVEDLERALEGSRGGGPGVLPIERKGGSWVQIPILGALDAWQNLYEHATDYETIAGFVTDGESDSPEAGEAAYTRMDRYFKSLGADIALHGRVHLHRLRRTVAVRALEATGRDLIGVQQLLGHKAITSTQRYVDEIDAAHVAKIQQKIR
jgi:integrase